jgi:hypothetical protein
LREPTRLQLREFIFRPFCLGVPFTEYVLFFDSIVPSRIGKWPEVIVQKPNLTFEFEP